MKTVERLKELSVSTSATTISRIRRSKRSVYAEVAKAAAMRGQPSNVVQLDARRAGSTRQDPRLLMEAVYSAGSLTLTPNDQSARIVAAILAGLGFFVVEEVREDGTVRPLPSADERRSSKACPWRVSKPPFGGETGTPDAAGAFPQRTAAILDPGAIRD